jgi:molecular chaperone GrpE (heat shock protein)
MHQKPISLTFAAAPVAGSPRRFSGVAYSGGVIPSYGWLGDVAIDLDSLKNEQGEELPILVDHEQSIDGIAGKGRIFKAIGSDGLPFLSVEGELSQATEAGKKVAALFAEGFPVQLSVGMQANVREVSEPVTVNGRQMKVSAIFEDATVREVSFVPVAADPNAKTQAMSAAINETQQEKSDMNEVESLKARIAELEAQIEAARIERRRADLSALFEAVGRDMPKDDKPYLEMSDAAFAAFAADLKEVAKPARDAALFAATSVGKAAAGKPEGEQQRLNALLSAVDSIIIKP